MSSAPMKFFSDPKLLEQVLLQLFGGNVPYTLISNIRAVLTLRRTNRNFARTMVESQNLRWRMGVLSKPRSSTTGVIHIAITALRRRDLSFPPFRFCARSSFKFTRTSTRPKTLWLLFSVSADNFAEAYLGTSGYRAGLQINIQTYRGNQHS